MALGRSGPTRAFVAAAALSLFAASSVAVHAQQSAPSPVPAVPAATPPGDRGAIRVQVLGAVSRPGEIELTVGDRLSTAVARAGAAGSVNPDLTRVFLIRADAATHRTVTYQINLFEALQRGDRRSDPILRQDDKVFVPQTRAPVFGAPHPPSGNGLIDT